MSAAAERIPYHEAYLRADTVANLIGPACERVIIAGSLRRLRPTIGDLELVAEPRMIRTLVPGDLFGHQDEVVTSLLDQRVDDLIADGSFDVRLDKNGRHALGPHYKRLTYQGRGLDLFIEDRHERWGVTLLLRTGSAEFNHRLVTQRAHGGWMPSGMRLKDAQLERWVSGDTWQALPTPTEADVFRLLGQAYVEPAQREV